MNSVALDLRACSSDSSVQLSLVRRRSPFVASGADRQLERVAVSRGQGVGHAVVQSDRLRALGVGDALLDRRAQDLRAGGVQDVGLVVGAGCDAVEPRALLGGAGVRLGEASDLVVVVVLERGCALDQALALGDDLALRHLALRVEVAADAVHRIVDVGVEARAQRRALAVVSRPVERGAAQVLQALGDRRSAVDRVAALLAEIGIGRVEQRVLLAGDEVVDQALDAMVVDRREGRRGGLFDQPLGDFEGNTHGVRLTRVRAPTPIKGNGFCYSRGMRAPKGGANAHSAGRKTSVVHRRHGGRALPLASERGCGRFPPSRSEC
jgi:hypothetical protein